MNTTETAPAGVPPVATVPEPYPGYAAELAARNTQDEKTTAAATDPFPGPLLDAFITDPPSLHGFTLEPVKMSLVMVLKKIKSPILDVMRILREELTRVDNADESTPELVQAARAARLALANERMAKEIFPEDETLSDTIYCFVHPIAEVRALLKKGRDIFNETAQREIGDQLTPLQVADLQRAVSAHYSAAFAPAVEYAPPKKDDGTVFPVPPASRKTDSAGG